MKREIIFLPKFSVQKKCVLNVLGWKKYWLLLLILDLNKAWSKNLDSVLPKRSLNFIDKNNYFHAEWIKIMTIFNLTHLQNN